MIIGRDEADRLIEKLADRFPGVFVADIRSPHHRPLAHGIAWELVERGVLSVDEASAVYRYYIKGRFWYAKSLVAGRPRINLNVQPDGFVTAADEAAVRPLIKAIELRAAKRAEQARAASKPPDKPTPPLPRHEQRTGRQGLSGLKAAAMKRRATSDVMNAEGSSAA